MESCIHRCRFRNWFQYILFRHSHRCNRLWWAYTGRDVDTVRLYSRLCGLGTIIQVGTRIVTLQDTIVVTFYVILRWYFAIAPVWVTWIDFSSLISCSSSHSFHHLTAISWCMWRQSFVVRVTDVNTFGAVLASYHICKRLQSQSTCFRLWFLHHHDTP